MAVAWEGGALTGGVDASGGSINVSPPASLASGELWVIAVVVDTNAAGTETVSLPSGWTSICTTQVIDSGVDNYPIFRAFYKAAGGSESAVTISFTGTMFNAAYANFRVSGQNASPIDGTPVTTTPSGDQTDYNAPDASVAANGSLGCTFLFAQNTSITAIPSGTTAMGTAVTGAFPSMHAVYQAVNSGTWSPGTWTNGADKIGALTFIVAPSGGGTPARKLSLLGVG